MPEKVSIVVTSVAEPNEALKALAKGCIDNGFDFIVIGDEASPAEFHIEGCEFYSLSRQRKSEFEFARQCPLRHYARKNIGYLEAIRNGSGIIIETDDDNLPKKSFWEKSQRIADSAVIGHAGWVNVYKYFSDSNIWPRGFPLEHLSGEQLEFERLERAEVDCPIQQGLCDGNPDVDAVYRLTLPLPQSFRAEGQVALAEGAWCPFNSQNTRWWKDAFRLLYLPAYCSFRMTDIWRSFIAQRIAWANGWSVLFHKPTVEQRRNEHNLLADFSDEVPGYLNNSKICEVLTGLEVETGVEKISDNMRLCYNRLIEIGFIETRELELLDVWLGDFEAACR